MVIRLPGGNAHNRDGRIKGTAITGEATVLMKLRRVVFMIESSLNFVYKYWSIN
jgi:hypothetical protein